MLLNISFCVYHFVEKVYVKDYEMLLVAYFYEYKILIGNTVQCSYRVRWSRSGWRGRRLL